MIAQESSSARLRGEEDWWPSADVVASARLGLDDRRVAELAAEPVDGDEDGIGEGQRARRTSRIEALIMQAAAGQRGRALRTGMPGAVPGRRPAAR